MNAATKREPVFSAPIAEVYDRYLVPLIFDPYAIDLAQRLATLPLTNLLELAAGTGVVTRRLAMTLPPEVFMIASDISQPMLDIGAKVGTSRPVEWRQADAMNLPFDNGSFDAVVCQFGVMFLPDRVNGYAEVRRVLRRGGVFIFNVWDSIEQNDFASVVSQAVAGLFPGNPPNMMARTPHGYHDIETIRCDLSAAGFSQIKSETVSSLSRAASPRIAAVAYCQGTPMRSEIEARDPARLTEATDVAEAALAARFGHSAIEGKIQAHVLTVEN